MCEEIKLSEDSAHKLTCARIALEQAVHHALYRLEDHFQPLFKTFGKTVLAVLEEEVKKHANNKEAEESKQRFIMLLDKLTDKLSTESTQYRNPLLPNQYITVSGAECDYVIYKLPKDVIEDYVDVLACSDNNSFDIIEYNPDEDADAEKEYRTLVHIKIPPHFKASDGKETISDGIVRVSFDK